MNILEVVNEIKESKRNVVVIDESEVYTIKDIQAYEEGTYYVLEVF